MILHRDTNCLTISIKVNCAELSLCTGVQKRRNYLQQEKIREPDDWG